MLALFGATYPVGRRGMLGATPMTLEQAADGWRDGDNANPPGLRFFDYDLTIPDA